MFNRWFNADSRLGPYDNISKVFAPQLVDGVQQARGHGEFIQLFYFVTVVKFEGKLYPENDETI